MVLLLFVSYAQEFMGAVICTVGIEFTDLFIKNHVKQNDSRYSRTSHTCDRLRVA